MAYELLPESVEALRNWVGGSFPLRHYMFEKRVVYESSTDWLLGCTAGGSVSGNGFYDLNSVSRTRATVKDWYAPDFSIRSPEYTGTNVGASGYSDATMGSPNPVPAFGAGLGTGVTYDSDGDIETTTASYVTWRSPHIDTLMPPAYGNMPVPYRWFHYDAYTSQIMTKTGGTATNLGIYFPFEGSTAELRQWGAGLSGSGMSFVGSGGAAGLANGYAGSMDSRGTACLKASAGSVFIPPNVIAYGSGWLSVWLNLYGAELGTSITRNTVFTIFRREGSAGAIRATIKTYEPGGPYGSTQFASDDGTTTRLIQYAAGSWVGWKQFIFAWGSFGMRIYASGTLGATNANYTAPLGTGQAYLAAKTASGTGDYCYFDDFITHTDYTIADNGVIGNLEAGGRTLYQLRFGSTAGPSGAITNGSFFTVAPTWPRFIIDADAIGSASYGSRYYQKQIQLIGTGTGSPP